MEEKNINAEEQLVVFNLGGETYGIDISVVHEIIRLQTITKVPRTPHFVEGVINLRGRIVPVIDLHKRFNLPVSEETQHSRIIVVEVAGVTVGMIVDSVSEVLRLPVANIEPPPTVISAGIDSAYLRGVGKWQEQLIILLDLDKVLHEKEQKELQQQSFAEAAARVE
ncbi:chemotaxis protein CheW [Zhaonella formicivorans]|uniref:chemotaxis protein CheW n=1 Tax=Zhaonella formicivorans TaxID=2528593 RepID=UPI0010E9E8F4|nr:chemotaxis protein CheW [Zhaonella formicivorans]